MYSNARPHNGSHVVYINKVEVPVVGTRVSYGVWQIPEIQISLAPDPVLQRLGAEDRVKIEVFFVDDFLLEGSGDEAVLRLLGEAEITGWGYQSIGNARAINFSASDPIAIFTQLFLQLLTNVDDMAGAAVDISHGIANLTPTRSELILPYSLFTNGLVGNETIKRPFDFVYNIVKAMTAKNMPDDAVALRDNTIPAKYRSVPAANFFAHWARRTNFINRFIATPVFDETDQDNVFPVLKSLQTTSALDTISRSLIGQVQNAGSIWAMLEVVMQAMFEEIVMLPTAPLITVDLKTSKVEETSFTAHTVTTASDGKVKATQATSPLHPNRLANYFVKPQLVFGLPPTCNVIFPSMIENYGYTENYATQATRLYFNDEVLNRLFEPRGHLGPAILNALAVAYPPEAALFQAQKKANLRSTGKNFLIFPEEFFKGPVMDRRSLPTWLYFLKQAEEMQKKTLDEAPTAESPYAFIKDEDPDVYALYAEYEYFRERYSRRAGSVTCKFNPFIVPGFPGVVFDRRSSRVDIFCYITRVEHVYQGRSVQTLVSFAYGRTFQEMFDLLRSDFAQGATAYAVAPRDPIKDVRDVIQHFDAAEQFYRALFFGRMKQLPAGKSAALDWRLVIGYRPLDTDDPDATPETILLDGTNTAAIDAYNNAVRADRKLVQELQPVTVAIATLGTNVSNTQSQIAQLQAIPPESQTAVNKQELDSAQIALAGYQAALTAAQGEKTRIDGERAKLVPYLTNKDIINKQVNHNLDPSRELVPMPAFADCFDNYDAAMQFVWRPVCSLDEFLIFTGGSGENAIPAFGSPLSIGAHYYERIGRMVPLPANFKLPTGADGLQSLTQPATSVPGLGPDFPTTRADWDKILLEYRNNVYVSKVPSE